MIGVNSILPIVAIYIWWLICRNSGPAQARYRITYHQSLRPPRPLLPGLRALLGSDAKTRPNAVELHGGPTLDRLAPTDAPTSFDTGVSLA